MTQSETRAGVILMIGASFVFAVQDGLSRHLSEATNVFMITMVRYWFFAVFAIAIGWREAGSIRAAAQTSRPGLQITRGVLLVVEIWVMVSAFVVLGLVESHAIFACYPLIATLLSVTFLGERVGWRRVVALLAGLIGVLVILQPGAGVFSVEALIPLTAALMFATYGVLTRLAAQSDSAVTSIFWTGVAGAVVATLVGVFFWEPMSAANWVWMALLCVASASSHYLLIRAYALARAADIQPFAYFQLAFAVPIGVLAFGDALGLRVFAGGALIVGAGVYTFLRMRRVEAR